MTEMARRLVATSVLALTVVLLALIGVASWPTAGEPNDTSLAAASTFAHSDKIADALSPGASCTVDQDVPMQVVGGLATSIAMGGISGAAERADAAAVDVGHAGIHQFPGIAASKSQFFDGADLGGLSNTGDLPGVVKKNGNIRYVLRGSGDVGVDRTTGLPTDIYTVIRKPDGSVLTMFPGTSPVS